MAYQTVALHLDLGVWTYGTQQQAYWLSIQKTKIKTLTHGRKCTAPKENSYFLDCSPSADIQIKAIEDDRTNVPGCIH